MSFAAGTQIATIDGNIPIEKLPKTGMVKIHDGSYIPFTFSSGCGTEYTIILTLSTGGEIICTPDQLFLGNEDWFEARSSNGMYLYDEDLEDNFFVKSIRVGGQRKVYKLGVKSGDYVLAGGIVVSV
jgi:hypothetical protein